MIPSQTDKTTFVLVHGASHRPAHWGPLIECLNSRGYRAVAPALPSALEDGASPLKDCQPDIDVIRKTIIKELDQGSNVIVVTHSYGGIPGLSALEGLDAATRAVDGFKTSVIAVAGIATFFKPVGKTVADDRDPSDPVLFDGTTIGYVKEDPGAIKAFYADLPKAEAEKWTAMLKPMSMMALLDSCRFAAYERIPTHYLLCRQDRAISIETQKIMVKQIREAGFDVRTEEVDASHSPFLSMPERTATFLRRCAGEEVPE